VIVVFDVSAEGAAVSRIMAPHFTNQPGRGFLGLEAKVPPFS